MSAQLHGSGVGGWANQAMVTDEGRLLVDASGISLHIGSVSANVDSIYIQSGNLLTGSMHVFNDATRPLYISGEDVSYIRSGDNLNISQVRDATGYIQSGTVYVVSGDLLTGSMTVSNDSNSPLSTTGSVRQLTSPWNILGSAHINSGTTYNDVVQVTDPWIILGSVHLTSGTTYNIIPAGSVHLTSGTTYNLISNVPTSPIPVSGEIEIFDTGKGPAGIDGATNNLCNIPIEHHEIHAGDHYFVKNFDVLASSGNSVSFGVDTPNTTEWAHMFWSWEGTIQTEFRVWEDATLSGAIALQVAAINNNRNSDNTSSLTITKNPVVSGASPTSGTTIFATSRGLAGATPIAASIGGGITREEELILQSGISYLFEFKTVGADNVVDYEGHWYENVDAN